MTRRCAVNGCEWAAAVGVQLIVSNDERREYTRWMCVPHLSVGLREMASTVDATIATCALAGLLDVMMPTLRDPSK